MSLACATIDPEMFTRGPIAIVNGHELGTQGMCNKKGSIDGVGAVAFVNDCLLPMFDARGKPPSLPPPDAYACAAAAAAAAAATRAAARAATLALAAPCVVCSGWLLLAVGRMRRPCPRTLRASRHRRPAVLLERAGGLKASRRASLTCDCCGTHMTVEFLEFCEDNHMVICLRTPRCSHAIQFEDLVNFWVFKNAASVLKNGAFIDLGWCDVWALLTILGPSPSSGRLLAYGQAARRPVRLHMHHLG